jgi:(R,R)-butanediol dehydrogenase / meso-butanediol dehydrogenase / diacetyl reductase
MRAARFYNKGDIRVDEIDEPIAENGKVQVAVEWCGICGSGSLTLFD